MIKKNIKIRPDISIKKAMRALDLAEEKIVLVVDDNERMIGCLSAGDIRRYILKYNDINGSIEKAYNKNPFFVNEDEYDADKVKKMLIEKRLELIPILDKDHKVVDYITWEDAHYDKARYKPKRQISTSVVIMAGGEGKRLDPFTRVLPKPLVPIGNKPIVELIIDKFRDYGIKDYYLVVNHMAKVLKAFFRENPQPYSIHFIDEDKPLGTAGSLRKLMGKTEGPLFVTNCDIIIETDYADLYKFHREKNFDVTLIASLKNYRIPYGICEMSDEGKLKKINEKPDYDFFVNTGLYVIKHEALKMIPEDTFFNMTDLIKAVKENNGSVGVFPVSEKSWIDVGEWAEYRKATEVLNKL